MFGSKLPSFDQGFLGDGSHIGAPTTFGVIIDQIVDRIGRGPVQCLADIVVFSAGRIQREVFYLIVGNQYLG